MSRFCRLAGCIGTVFVFSGRSRGTPAIDAPESVSAAPRWGAEIVSPLANRKGVATAASSRARPLMSTESREKGIQLDDRRRLKRFVVLE